MSGICGLWHLDGQAARQDDVAAMLARMAARGPDASGVWIDDSVGLGHGLLQTSAESSLEPLPYAVPMQQLAITGDVRLDNRDELIGRLAPGAPAGRITDTRLVLEAYDRWGGACVDHFLGDFAFVIWDARRRALFCARDHFGMRPFAFHHAPGRLFAFASDPRALLATTQVPARINEARIADFLVDQLEGIDKTSTFFSDIVRLPPAHTLTVSSSGIRLRRYWRVEPQPELRLPSDAAYAEAFRDVFTAAVRCRVRGDRRVGSMLSGGMDSGSTAAVARVLLAEAGRGPLPTFSATSPDPATCIETRTIQAAVTMEGLDPWLIHHGQLEAFAPELENLSWDSGEPFDASMTLPLVMYLAARRRGVRVLLDGAAGDLVLSEGSHIMRLIRRGRWLSAVREAVGQKQFFGGDYPAYRELYASARTALVPDWVRRMRYRRVAPRRFEQMARQAVGESLLAPELAERVSLADRFRAMAGPSNGALLSYAAERARWVDAAIMTVARERYDRVASAVGVEPCDPFLDLRVVQFCLGLPGDQKLHHGWPKVIQRRAMAGRMPDEVRWRRGQPSLGWPFTKALMTGAEPRLRAALADNRQLLAAYVDLEKMDRVAGRYFASREAGDAHLVFGAAHLGLWLRRSARAG